MNTFRYTSKPTPKDLASKCDELGYPCRIEYGTKFVEYAAKPTPSQINNRGYLISIELNTIKHRDTTGKVPTSGKVAATFTKTTATFTNGVKFDKVAQAWTVPAKVAGDKLTAKLLAITDWTVVEDNAKPSVTCGKYTAGSEADLMAMIYAAKDAKAMTALMAGKVTVATSDRDAFLKTE